MAAEQRVRGRRLRHARRTGRPQREGGRAGEVEVLDPGEGREARQVERADFFIKSRAFDCSKAERELGYTYGPLEPAITDAL